MRTCAVIPCYNEEKTIADIVHKTKKYCDRVIVVDNNSEDNTREEAGKLIPCYDIQSCYIRGAGITTAYGLIRALNPLKYFRADVIVTLDGDGQHNPDNILEVVKPIVNREADVVIGSRFLNGYSIPKYRKFGIDIITWLFNVGSGQKISDAQSCFRAFSYDALKAVMPIKEIGFSFSVEMLVKARAKGMRIVEVPIDCIYYDDGRQNSTINPIRHGLGVALGTVKWRWKCRG